MNAVPASKSPTPAPTRGQLIWRHARELVSEPAPLQWLVRDVFERACLALWYGDAASCKTWLMLSMALAIAAGLDWMGCPVHRGAVFILAGEGNRALRRRIAGIAKQLDLDLTDVPLFVSDRAASLSADASVAEVIEAIRGLVEETGFVPVLVVVDTLSRNFGDGDENATPDMAKFVRGLDWIKEELGATVLLIHHVGHGDKTRARGNSTLRGALDAEYRITKDDLGVIQLECTKAKDFDEPAPRHFTLVDVELDWRDEDGLPVRSAAVVLTEPSTPANVSVSGLGKRQIEALRMLREEYTRRRQNLDKGHYDSDQARVELDYWREMMRGAGFTRQQLYKTVERLEIRGAITIEGLYVRLRGEEHRP